MEIYRGKIESAQKIVVYGPEGIGKSTFASLFPNPLFIDTESSTKRLDVARTPTPTSWAMLINLCQQFKTDPMGFQTLIIDTADWAERLCLEQICANAKVGGIEDFGYGKGYVYLTEEFGRLLNLLSDIVDNGINVVLNAHAIMRKFEQPDEIGAYDRWELKLQKKTAPLVKEWADMLLFINYETHVINIDNQGAQKGKNKAQGGRRVMYTAHHSCWDAKNRVGLPEKTDFDYSVIAPYILTREKDHEQNAQIIEAPSKPTPQPTEGTTSDIPDIPFDEAIGTDKEIDSIAPSTENIPRNNESAILRSLYDLMAQAQVTELELQRTVAKAGYFPPDMPINDYPPDFIAGVLIGAWEQVFNTIKEMRVNK